MRIRLDVLLLATGLGAARAGGQSPGVVDVTEEPSHHLVLSNNYVKVLDVRVAPHTTTLVHRHADDYLFITVAGAEITNSRVGSPPVEMTLRDGAVNFAAGGFAHSATVNTDETFHNLTIIFAHPARHFARCDSMCTRPVTPVPCPMEVCPSVDRVMSSDEWTVDSVTVPPGAELLGVAGEGDPTLVVGVSSVHLTKGRPSAGNLLMQGGPGTFAWLGDGGAIGNADQAKPARVVVLRFTGAALGAAGKE